MASSSSGSPCAACKFLRRKCTSECVFAPYFPPDQPLKFANVHKIFGASNISKLLNDLPPHQREDAVNSLAYEADARVKDPVYGCVGAISLLQRQVAELQQELGLAQSDLARAAQQHQQHHHQCHGLDLNVVSVSSDLSHSASHGPHQAHLDVLRQMQEDYEQQHPQEQMMISREQWIEIVGSNPSAVAVAAAASGSQTQAPQESSYGVLVIHGDSYNSSVPTSTTINPINES